MPGARRLARLPAEPSPEARQRLKVVQGCEAHGGQIRLTARHFGLSPDTVSRWWRAYQAHGVPGLEPRSRRPKRRRQLSTPPEVVARIQVLREQYPAGAGRSSGSSSPGCEHGVPWWNRHCGA